MKLDKPTLEKLCIDAGHVINRSNGQCALVEDFACRVTTLCVELLKREESDVARQCVTIFTNALSIVEGRLSTVEPLAMDTLNAGLVSMKKYADDLKRGGPAS